MPQCMSPKLAHLYGPAARCKPKVMIWRSWVLRFCIRPLTERLSSWPSWISARARSHSRLGPEGHKGHRQNIRMQALNGANEPGSKTVLRPVRRPQQNNPGCLDEEHAQVAVAAFGDASEDSPISGRHLFGHEAEPSRIIPPSRPSAA